MCPKKSISALFLILPMLVACGADSDTSSTEVVPLDSPNYDAEVQSAPPDFGIDASMTEIDAGMDNVADVGQTMIPEPPSTEVCESFDETHLYRQSAERFADYEIREMCDYRGELLLIVNTASKCGLTPQYEGLTALDERYGSQGLRILGFLSNDFGNQAGSQDEVEMCNSDYRVDFEQFTPVGVLADSSDGQDPIFRWLTNQSGFEGDVEWNFGKFLVNSEGQLIARWSSYLVPENDAIITAIESALETQAGTE